MARELAQTVVLWDDEKQKPVVLMAGSTPTKEQAEQIDNPKAWDADYESPRNSSAYVNEPEVVEAPAEDEPEPEEEPAEVPAEDEGAAEDEVGPPAKSANKDEWVAYAASKGIELEDAATKADYQDAVAAL